MSASFNVIKTWEPDFLSPMLNAPDLGSEFTTGAHQGTNARLLIAVNNCECSRTVNLDFTPYRYAGAPTVQRVRLVANASYTDTLSNTTTSTQTFEPGQAMLFRFVATAGTSRPYGFMQ